MPTFDASSNPGSETTLDISWTHTPVGVPRGVIVQIVQNVGTTDEVTGVTYGGVAMARVAAGTVFHTTGAEDGAVYTYFLGSSIPTGARTVLVSVDGTGSDKTAACCTVTAPGNTEAGPAGTLDSGGVANPSVTISTPADIEFFVVGAILSGVNAISGIAPSASYTEIYEQNIGANQVASFIRRTSNSQSASVVVDWVAASDEAGVGAATVRDESSTPVLLATGGGMVGSYYDEEVMSI